MPHAVELCELAGDREWRRLYVKDSVSPEGVNCQWSPGGRVLISRHKDFMRLWDTDNGRQMELPQTEEGEILDLAFHADGSSLVAATSAGLRCWSTRWDQTNSDDLLVLGPQDRFGADLAVTGLGFADRGTVLAAAVGGTMQVFDWPNRRLLRTLRLETGFYGWALSPSGRLCVGGLSPAMLNVEFGMS